MSRDDLENPKEPIVDASHAKLLPIRLLPRLGRGRIASPSKFRKGPLEFDLDSWKFIEASWSPRPVAARKGGWDARRILRDLSRGATGSVEKTMREALERGRRIESWILRAEGGGEGPDSTAARLGVSPQTLQKMVRSGDLLALRLDDGKRVYPQWQFAGNRILPGLGQVLRGLAGQDPWAIACFFLGKEDRLGGRSPLDALRRGDIEQVVRSARVFGRQGGA